MEIMVLEEHHAEGLSILNGRSRTSTAKNWARDLTSAAIFSYSGQFRDENLSHR